jgi:glycosyltransferase involved in cell wall biosynthesis
MATHRRSPSAGFVRWPRAQRGRDVAIVTVNYNTRDDVALLLWSICRNISDGLHSVLVVDNGSTDDSAVLLAGCAEAGLCTLMVNETNRYHGPALNQALSHLATTQSEHPPRWVWVLDSDCVVTNPSVLNEATTVASERGAALLGERRWDQWHDCNRLAVHSLLVDPSQVWQPTIAAFEEGGDPSYELERSCVEAGLPVVAFPFVSEGYVIHRGRSTLARVRERDDSTNRLYDWATTHYEPHFEIVPGAREAYGRLLDAFRSAVPILDAQHLAAACQSST